MQQDLEEDHDEEEMSNEQRDAAARELNERMAKHREQLKKQLLEQQAREKERMSQTECNGSSAAPEAPSELSEDDDDP